MQNGTYKTLFKTPLGDGSGVIIIDGDNIRGGDSSMYYIGTKEQNGENISAKIIANVHTNVPGMSSVFGVDHVNITLEGTTKGDTASMSGEAKEAPGVPFEVTITKIEAA